MNPAKLLAIAVGGYFLYNWFQDQEIFGGVANNEPSGGKPTGEMQLVTKAPPTPAPSLKQRLLAEAHAGGYTDPVLLNMHEWCFYYAQVAGKPCPDPTLLLPGIAQDLRLPVDQFVAGATQYGLSGLRGWRRW